MTTLTSPHDLLAAIPFLIGYHPSDSLVLVAIKGDQVSMAMRVDYPRAENSDAYDLLAHHIKLDGADAALMLAYVPSGGLELYQSGTEVLSNLSISLAKNSIAIRESIEVIGNCWRSVICRDISCCPPEGNVLPDFDSSRVAAEQVMAGRTLPFIDVSKLADSIAALPSIGVEFIAQVESYFVHEDSPDLNEKQRDGATAVVDLGLLYEADRGSSDPDLVAQVIGRLSDIQVRDYALGIHNAETIEAYWTMWKELLRIAPVGYVAPIASIFAAVAYESGQGALAHKALDRALIDNPGYSLALLLRRVFSAGWPAAAFIQMREQLHPKVKTAIFEAN
jgi:hypothetical protein